MIMKKLFWVVAAVAVVCSVSSASAQCDLCGQKVKLKYDDPTIHQAYENGDINLDDVRLGLEKTGYCWRVKDMGKMQAWKGATYMGQDVVVKLKETKKKKFVKVDVLGEKRMFAKDLTSPNGKKHVGKIRENGEKHVKKNIVNEDGMDIILYEKPAKKSKKK